MDARLLDVLHHGGHERILAVSDGVGLGFDGVFQIAVDQNRPVRRHVHRRRHVIAQHRFVVDDFHAPPAEHVGRPHHQRIADAGGDFDRFGFVGRHAARRHRNAQFPHDLIELFAVFRQVNHRWRRAEDIDAGLLELAGDVQRSLAAELADHTLRLFLLIDLQHVLDGQRLEVELVRGVVVG